ncbi:hypothetical protein KY326_00885 [Candidatus Woesearchaeota archaeon]|nr:hypothetical protein [Candidatus Woesearchaeota archaeon]
MVTFEKVKKGDLKQLMEFGFGISETKSKYEDARMKGPCVLVLFKSGKLLLQGNDIAVKKAEKLLLDLKIGKLVKKILFAKESGVIIGSDEALKGDTFGGLVVAGVRADDKQREILRRLGVEDSKLLTDENVKIVAKQIMQHVHYSIKNLNPEKYNKEVEKYGMTSLLDKLHKGVAEDLDARKGAKHIVDKYPGCKVGDIIETKADSRYLEAAAASILARDAGLRQLKMLGVKLGMDVPKGSTHVKEALEALKRKNLPISRFVKVHFSNVKSVFGGTKHL